MPNVQVIENWADVTGRLIAVRPHPRLEGYISAALSVSDIRSVPGFANLFETAKGQTIEVNVPVEAIAAATEGSTVSWRIRKAGASSNFAHPGFGTS
jgi:hypothetical protein